MTKVKPTHSDCCKAELQARGGFDRCSNCNGIISYALVGRFHGETPAVCKLYDDSLWFFWQQTTDWQHVLDSEQEYVGQIKEVVDSIGCRHNRDSDLIERGLHLRFSNEYKPKVKNPEYAL